jgi:hypothetical protein
MPTAKELEDIERKSAARPDPLVHEPWLTPEERMSGRRQMRAPAQRGSGKASAPPKAKPPRRGGFA